MVKPSDPVDLLNFIDEVKKIKLEYDTIAKYTGVNFNIFNILDVSSKEVKLHSNFLAEMLNPKGSHMQGDIFLNFFLEEIKDEIKWGEGENKGFKIVESEVHKEFWTGKINKDYTEGGSIDILIHNKHQGIIIENKIYADDQPKQLLRYYNFGKKTFNSDNNFRVLYLTLDCSAPSEGSTNGIKHFSCISYKNHIKNWLEKCLTVVYDFPLVFALIRQYLNHIKHLTNESIFEKMNEELKKKITKDSDAFKAAIEISQTIESVRDSLFEEIKSYFKGYFTRVLKPQCILDLNVDITLGEDRSDGFWVALIKNNLESEDVKFDKIKEIAKNAGGSNGSSIYLSWYTLKSIPTNLKSYSDDDMYLLLNKDNLNKLYKKIDAEIEEFLNKITTAYNNTI